MRYESVFAVDRRLVHSIDRSFLLLLGHCFSSPDPVPDLVDLVNEILLLFDAHNRHFFLLGLDFFLFFLELDGPEGELDVRVDRG